MLLYSAPSLAPCSFVPTPCRLRPSRAYSLPRLETAIPDLYFRGVYNVDMYENEARWLFL